MTSISCSPDVDPTPQANDNDTVLPDAATIDGSPSDAPIASHNTNVNDSILEQQLVRWASPDATTIDGSPSDAPIDNTRTSEVQVTTNVDANLAAEVDVPQVRVLSGSDGKYGRCTF